MYKPLSFAEAAIFIGGLLLIGVVGWLLPRSTVGGYAVYVGSFLLLAVLVYFFGFEPPSAW